MHHVLDFVRGHWLSLSLLIGAAAASWYVYKHRDTLLIK